MGNTGSSQISVVRGFSNWGSQSVSRGVAKCFENLLKC